MKSSNNNTVRSVREANEAKAIASLVSGKTDTQPHQNSNTNSHQPVQDNSLVIRPRNAAKTVPSNVARNPSPPVIATPQPTNHTKSGKFQPIINPTIVQSVVSDKKKPHPVTQSHSIVRISASTVGEDILTGTTPSPAPIPSKTRRNPSSGKKKSNRPSKKAAAPKKKTSKRGSNSKANNGSKASGDGRKRTRRRFFKQEFEVEEETVEDLFSSMHRVEHEFWRGLPYFNAFSQSELRLLLGEHQHKRVIHEPLVIPPLGEHWKNRFLETPTTKRKNKKNKIPKSKRESLSSASFAHDSDGDYVDVNSSSEEGHSSSSKKRNSTAQRQRRASNVGPAKKKRKKGDVDGERGDGAGMYTRLILSSFIGTTPPPQPPPSSRRFYLFEGRAKVHVPGKRGRLRKFTNVPTLSLDQAATVDFKQDIYEALEIRVAAELKSLDLIRAPPDPARIENDEVSAELRYLQSKLEEQKRVNAARRIELLKLGLAKIEQQKATRLRKREIEELEKKYLQMLLLKKKKKEKTGSSNDESKDGNPSNVVADK
eukprot:TRINITY_DN8693_c0_g1_i1.p1 TRINITY_DN8693_c0_g1~~TRINITY_DN8693_c0_g1_i1.p1  ORF type:complete len:540 (+),score=103.22 TRINITY_DN8693_c0_g1_i1:1529-3148(+)